MSTRVDDTSSSFSYSGGWSVGGNTHNTNSVGATTTIRFTGTRVSIYGTNPASAGGNILATFTLDGASESFQRNSHSVQYAPDHFWTSHILADTTHTLVIRNEGSQIAFMLDYVDITGGSAVAPPPAAAPGTINTPATTRVNNSPPQTTAVVTSVRVVTSVATSIATLPGSQSNVISTVLQTLTSTSTDTLPLSSSHTTTGASTSSTQSQTNVLSQSLSVDPVSGETVTAFQVVTTSIGGQPGQVTLYPDADGGFNPTGASSKGVPIGATIGAVLGSLVFALLVGLCLVLFIRRRRRQAALTKAIGPAHEDAEAPTMTQRRPLTSPAFPSRIGESIRPTKFRSQHRGSRGFERLEEESTEAEASITSPTITSEPPSLNLNLNTYPAEKRSSLMASLAGYSAAATDGHNRVTSTGHNTVVSASAYSEDDDAPPAYHRASSVLPPGHISIAQG